MSDYPRVMEQVFPHDPDHVTTVRQLIAHHAHGPADADLLLRALGLDQ